MGCISYHVPCAIPRSRAEREAASRGPPPPCRRKSASGSPSRAEETARGPAADPRERESEQDQVDRMRGSGREGERVGIDCVDPHAGTGIGRDRRVDDQGAAIARKGR